MAFARPHELDIVVDAAAAVGVSARVSRILAFGVAARVELDGDDATAGQHFEVELPRARIAELALAEGQVVRLVPSWLQVFGRDTANRAGAEAAR